MANHYPQNWFQNRRAKAKQQKRQEEFEKMQKAKAEAEESARRKSETLDQLSESRQPSASTEEPERSPTPKQTTVTAEASANAEASSNRKHHKTKSESAREATFASLQRALNAAVAARDRFSRRGSRSKNESPQEEDEAVSPTSMAPPKTALKAPENKARTGYNPAYADWPDIKEESASWASHGNEGALNYGHSEAHSFPPTSQGIPEVPNPSHSVQNPVDAFSGPQFPAPAEEWTGSPRDHTGSDAGLGYNMQYSVPMQTPDISMDRRESSDALTTSLSGIGICTTGSSQPSSRAGSVSWKEPSKELDLAARRKRPRPAAIGTSNTRSLAASTSMSSLSPKSRMANSGAGNSMRHSKSAQSLNTRYAGVRKSSAAQRSPLNFTFAEAGSMKSSKAEMLRPSVSSSTLAPPTPLTPQDFQHFMPGSPTDSNYCMSAHSTSQFFPTSQPMQVNIASPPTTPLDLYSSFPYQNVAPPMSAPPQVNNFPEYVTCDAVPLAARSWADTASLSSPDFSHGIPVSHSSTVSPIGFDQSADHSGQGFGMEPVSGSPSLIYSIEDADMPGSENGDRKQPEFMLHEFPEQQESHRFAAHPMASMQKPKAFTFANNATPSNYPP